MNDNQVANAIVKNAKIYKANLENKNILFIFQSRENKEIGSIETLFEPKQFLHLTGVLINRKNVRSAIDFYELAISEKLNPSHFQQENKRLVEDKLNAFNQTMFIHKTAKEIGNFNNNSANLYTDKISGNTTACLGFIVNDGVYIPNTNLYSNVRTFISQPYNVIMAIYRKDVTEDKYSELTFAGKGIDINKLVLPLEISEKISVIKPDDITETLKPQTTPQVQQKKLGIFEDLERIRQEQEAAHKKEPKPPNISPVKPKR